MRTLFLLFAVLSAIGSSVEGKRTDPPKPNLAQTFVSNFSIFVPQLAPPYFGGKLWVDYKIGGGKVIFGGEQLLPIYVHTNFIATPQPGDESIEGYMFENSNCWDVGNFSDQWLQLFPLHIPDVAQFAGNITTDDGRKCSRWVWSEQSEWIPWAAEMWVDYSNDAVVQFMVPFLTTYFFDTKVQNIDPNIYHKPNLTCEPAPPYEDHTKAFTNLIHILEQAYFPSQLPSQFETDIDGEYHIFSQNTVLSKSKSGDPPIPSLPQQYYTSWVQYVYGANNTPIAVAAGDFAIDNKLGGVKLEYGADDAPQPTPMTVKITGLISPDGANVTGYIYAEEICWNMGAVADSNWLQIFPLKIPSDATFLGNVTADDGRICSSWAFQDQTIYGGANLIAWVAYGKNDVVRLYIDATVIDYGGSFYYDFFSTKIGPVNPKVFYSPAYPCTPLSVAQANPFAQIATAKMQQVGKRVPHRAASQSAH